MHDLATRLQQYAKVETNASMADYTSFRAGGCARYLVFPEDEEALTAVVREVKQVKILPT